MKKICSLLLALVLCLALVPGVSAEDSPFTDVPAGWSSAPAAAWAAEQGVTTGATATTFNPGGICTRGEIVTFLYRAYGK